MLNLDLWDSMATTDRKFTKPIVGKTYRGDSPNPTYVIKKLTAQLGPVGQKWGFTVVKETIHNGRPHKVVVRSRKDFSADGTVLLTEEVECALVFEQLHQVEIEFWQIADDGFSRHFSAFGGTPLLYMSKKGDWVHDEDAAKKSLTDALTKAASQLGACADIFLGVFDTKYVEAERDPLPMNDDPTPTEAEKKAAAPHTTELVKEAPKRKSSTPDGW